MEAFPCLTEVLHVSCITLRRVIESTDIWTEFNETVEPVDGKIVIGLTYSKGENPTADESFLDLAAIKNLEVE